MNKPCHAWLFLSLKFINILLKPQLFSILLLLNVKQKAKFISSANNESFEMNTLIPQQNSKKNLENHFSFPTSIFAEDKDKGSLWKMLFSRNHKIFGLYLLHDTSNFVLQDVFHDYSGAKPEVKKMIDRTPGMKEKINNFFN